MKAAEFYNKVGEVSSGEDLVKIIDKDSGATSTITSIIREEHPETGHSTLWVEVTED